MLSGFKLDALEDVIYQQGRTSEQPLSQPFPESRSAAASFLQEGLALLLEKLNSQPADKRTCSDTSDANDDISRQVTQETSRVSRPLSHNIEVHALNKRKRMHESAVIEPDDWIDASSSLPPPAVMKTVIDAYFILVQPWIPIFHEKLFRQRLRDPVERRRLEIVLHAMTVALLRHIDSGELSVDLGDVERICERSRKIVILTGMEDMLVENLQALIIICFEDVRLFSFTEQRLIISLGY